MKFDHERLLFRMHYLLRLPLSINLTLKRHNHLNYFLASYSFITLRKVTYPCEASLYSEHLI